MEREHNERMHLAWHVAALMRVRKDKQLPKMQKLMMKPTQRRTRGQPIAKQIAVARMWSALGYGKMKKGELTWQQATRS